MPLQSELLPILVSHLDNTDARDFLEGAALANRSVYLPLVAPPMDRSPHLLEVMTPEAATPLRLIAYPIGPPTDAGFPLKLALYGTSVAVAARPVSVSIPPAAQPVALRPKKKTATTQLTKRHTQDLEGLNDSGDENLSSALVEDLTGREIAGGKLVIEACVGTGGAGTVHRARHRDLQMAVAVKVMHESFQNDFDYCRRFHAEALSASRLDHPNLTRVLDFGQEPDGLLYLAMEYLDGRSLRDVLDAETRIEFSRVAQIMIQVCSGLTHAHARDVVHRDIKPENVVLTRGLDDDGRETEIAKVCDFGIAHAAMTGQAAVFAGTPEYMAPEQFRGEPPDVQSDVYSCGVLMYELLTGQVPITGETMQEVFTRQATMDPDPPSRHVPGGLDPRIDRLVLKALTKEREARHLNARELRNELRSIAEDIAVFTTGGWHGSRSTSSDIQVSPVTAEAAATWSAIRDLGSMPSGAPPPPSAPRSSRSPAGPSPPTAESSDWLEHGRDYMTSSLMPGAPIAPKSASTLPTALGSSPGSSPPAAGSLVPPAYTAEPAEVTRVVVPYLQRLVQTHDPGQLAILLQPLEPQIRKLAAHGYATTLWRIRSTLDMIASEKGSLDRRACAAHVALVLKVFEDPLLLGPLAEKALDGLEDKERMASKLCIRAGYGGAHALYAARLKHAVFEARERFVALLLEIGAPALPLFRAGLDMLQAKVATVPGALTVAEDLLKAVPSVADDALGELLARYARSPSPTLAVLATNALPKAWGQRSRALLIALLGHTDDTVSIAALSKLRELGALDEHIVGKLEPIILGTIPVRAPMRIASGEALAFVSPDAAFAAKKLLAHALQVTVGNTPDVEDLVVCFANSLLAIKGDGAPVVARWKSSTTWLRTRLEAVLRHYPNVPRS